MCLNLSHWHCVWGPAAMLHKTGTTSWTLLASEKGMWTGSQPYLCTSGQNVVWECSITVTGTVWMRKYSHWKRNTSRRRNSLDRNLPIVLMQLLYHTSYRHISKSFPAFDSRSSFFSHLAICAPVKDCLYCDNFKTPTVFEGLDWRAVDSF